MTPCIFGQDTEMLEFPSNELGEGMNMKDVGRDQ